MSQIGDVVDKFLTIPGLRGYWVGGNFERNGMGGTINFTRNGNITQGMDNELPVPYSVLDGSGDYFSAADSAEIDLRGNETYIASAKRGVTFGGWFYLNSLTGGPWLIGKDNIDAGSTVAYYLRVRSVGLPRFGISDTGASGGHQTLDSSVTITTGGWYFIIGRFDPSSELAIFVNGTKTTTSTTKSSIANTADALQIGRSGSSSVYLDGRVGMVFLSSMYLSDAILEDLYSDSKTLFNAIAITASAQASASVSVSASISIAASAAGGTNLRAPNLLISALAEAAAEVTAPIIRITAAAVATARMIRVIRARPAAAASVSVSVGTLSIPAAAQASTAITITGAPVTPPAAETSGGLEASHVLRLLYGNDKRNPRRTLDLAQSAQGNIFLKTSGFTAGSGELIELWSGPSLRFEGQKKFAESRDNSRLSVHYNLFSGSQAGLSSLQRQINQFFLEAKLYQRHQEGHKVWLEYRWADGLGNLPTPAFGQLSGYYEVYAANIPRWPDDLHTGALVAGNIEDVVLDLVCSPAAEGLEQKAAVATGTLALVTEGVRISSGASSRLHWTSYTNSGLTGQFTVTGWFTPYAAWSSGNKDIFDYYVNASNRIRLYYDASNTRFTLTKIVGGSTFSGNSTSFTAGNGDDVHVQIIQDSTTLRLFVNGTQRASFSATATMTDGGTIAIGCPATGTIDGIDAALDGWRIMADDLTSTQALTLYNAELPIKQQGGQVGPPPYFWTLNGAGQINTVDDTSRNNWGILGGVGGDMEAKTRIELTSFAATARQFWIGLKSQDESFTPSSYLWREITGSATVDATASDGSYFQASGTSVAMPIGASSLDGEKLHNKYRLLGRFKTSGSAAVSTFWSAGGYQNNYLRNLTLSNTSFQIVDFGDVFIGGRAPETLNYYAIQSTFTAGSSITVGGDFFFLLPAPYTRISNASAWGSGAAVDVVVVYEGVSFYRQAGQTMPRDYFEYRGERIRAIPQKLNYLFVLQVEESSQDFGVTQTVAVTVSVTPRYLLPGGMVS